MSERFTVKEQDGLYPFYVLDTKDDQIFGEFPTRREAEYNAATMNRNNFISAEDH